MTALFVVHANTPEEMRHEIVTYLRREADKYRTEGYSTVRVQAKRAAQVAATVCDNQADFIAALKIEGT